MKRTPIYLGIVSILAMTGCASNDPSNEQVRIHELEKKLERSQKELDAARSQYPSEPVSIESSVASSDLLPPDAEPGMCYARVWVEPTYTSYSEQVVVREARDSVSVTPARYDWVDQTVLVQPASTRIEEVPTVYATDDETIMVEAAQMVWRTGAATDDAPASRQLVDAAQAHGISLEQAEPGMCFHEHYRPPQYKTTAQQVEISPASYRIETSPAEYRWVEKEVLVSEASTELREIPAEYVTEVETMVDVPAHTMWKKGKGPMQRIDEATGEIMCLVDVPATHKNISKRVLKSPARTEVVEIPAEYKTIKVKELVAESREQRVEIPARFSTVDVSTPAAEAEFLWHEVRDRSEPSRTRTGARICLTETPAKYQTISRQIVVSPATTRTWEIPAEYETVRVKKLLSEAIEVRTDMPAEYETVTLQQVDTEAHMEWRSILCETNTTPDLIRQLQTALSEKGYNPGTIDGYVGGTTMNAVNSYQLANNLPVDKFLNTQTLKHLDVL